MLRFLVYFILSIGVLAEEVKEEVKWDAKKDPKGEGKKYLEAKEKEDGVIKLPSGLMYKVLQKGNGKVHPLVSTPCDCHYEGKLIDGTKFDSSYDRGQPTTFAPNQVIKGWTEAMQLMVEGDQWEMYIPSELAYGASGSPPKIPGDSTLVFKMEIVKVKGEGKPAVTCDPFTKEDCSEKEAKYVDKQMVKEKNEQQSEYDRLNKMFEENKKTKNLTKKTRVWLEARVNILKKIVEGKKEEL